jgi:hypothetical protein
MWVAIIGQTNLKISVSDGVDMLWDDGAEGAAWAARNSWRLPTEPERAVLIAGTAARPENSLIVVSLPSQLLQQAQRTLLGGLSRSNGYVNLALAAAVQDFRISFREALAEHGIHIDDAGPTDLIVNRPGQRSTAYDYARHRLVGLHIDNHQSLPLDQRGRAFVLANINVGWQSRYLDFIPASVAALQAALPDVDANSAWLPRDIKDAYLRARPESQVVRVTLPPGTAYLLNTQNCIHDGATAPGEVPDAAFLMMGNVG